MPPVAQFDTSQYDAQMEALRGKLPRGGATDFAVDWARSFPGMVQGKNLPLTAAVAVLAPFALPAVHAKAFKDLRGEDKRARRQAQAAAAEAARFHALEQARGQLGAALERLRAAVARAERAIQASDSAEARRAEVAAHLDPAKLAVADAEQATEASAVEQATAAVLSAEQGVSEVARAAAEDVRRLRVEQERAQWARAHALRRLSERGAAPGESQEDALARFSSEVLAELDAEQARIAASRPRLAGDGGGVGAGGALLVLALVAWALMS